MNRLNKTESAIFVSLMWSLLPKDLHSELISFRLIFSVHVLILYLKKVNLYTVKAFSIFWQNGNGFENNSLNSNNVMKTRALSNGFFFV